MNIFTIKIVVEDAKIATIFYGVLPFIVTDILRLVLLIALRASPSGCQGKCEGDRPVVFHCGAGAVRT